MASQPLSAVLANLALLSAMALKSTFWYFSVSVNTAGPVKVDTIAVSPAGATSIALQLEVGVRE